MKFRILILSLLAASCGYKADYVKNCVIKDKQAYQRTLESCVKGQRQVTHYDDADDVIKQCRFAAKEISEECNELYMVSTKAVDLIDFNCHYSAGCIPCDLATTSIQKETCRTIGWVHED